MGTMKNFLKRLWPKRRAGGPVVLFHGDPRAGIELARRIARTAEWNFLRAEARRGEGGKNERRSPARGTQS